MQCVVRALALLGIMAAFGATALGASQTSTTQYQAAFGIDYAHPEMYLAQGPQSKIAKPTQLDWLRGRGPSLAHLGEIYALIHEYATYSSGGATIGTVTADGILSTRRLSGCHDFALVFAAVARNVGYPAIMVDTADAGWVLQRQSGTKGPYVGHVFVEVFLINRWILVDPTSGYYVDQGYNPAIGAIRKPGGGYYGGSWSDYLVMFKGLDTQSYGIYSNAELTVAMVSFARRTDLAAVSYPSYSWKRF